MASRGWTALVACALLATGATAEGSPERVKPQLVAVVGAGAAGLTAARTLTELGHQVVVFEQNDRVGGKVYTLRTPDLQVELGAILVTTTDDYPITLGYAAEFDVPVVPSPNPIMLLDEYGTKLTLEQFLLSRYSLTQIMVATQNYAAVLAQFADFIASPGFEALPADLARPFNEFAALYGIEPVAELVRAVMVGYGYGYYETVPAAYYIKFLPFLVKVGPTGLVTSVPHVFPTGFQSLYEALAATLDVRLSSEVTQIRRTQDDDGEDDRETFDDDEARGKDPSDVVITINGKKRYTFDAVIITAPLEVVSSFLDETPAERQLFAQIQSNRYFVTTFGAAGLTTGEALYFYGNAFPERINHVGVWSGREDPNGLFAGNAYQIADSTLAPAELLGVLASDVASQGGVFLAALVQQEWPRYFPHVTPDLISSGFYDSVEALQGSRHTYYTGTSLTFETVEHAARHAKALVLQHFPNCSPVD